MHAQCSCRTAVKSEPTLCFVGALPRRALPRSGLFHIKGFFTMLVLQQAADLYCDVKRSLCDRLELQSLHKQLFKVQGLPLRLTNGRALNSQTGSLLHCVSLWAPCTASQLLLLSATRPRNIMVRLFELTA